MKIDYPPLLQNGFQEIGLWQLDQYFLEPFSNKDTERRLRLINRFKLFLEELIKLGIPLEVWIDGSFTTQKVDPDDIDVVVWAKETDTDTLSTDQGILFEKLLINRDYVRVRYDIDVYLGDASSQSEYDKWLNEFGKDQSKLNPKGIFKLKINHV